jgi:hypothetical protein
MSASTAIGMVSRSLWNLLDDAIILDPDVPVTIQAPDETTGGNRRINLFLYKVIENPELKNMDWQVRADNTSQLVPPPLSLKLYYLMTAYASNDEETGNSNAHEVLGDAMRVLYENPIIPTQYLDEGLEDAREQIKIMQINFDMEELSQVWNTTSQPFRLSVMYEVSVVQLDMLTARERAMAERVRQIGVPQIKAPFSPPVVNNMNPASGPVGTTVTFGGENLTGWVPYVNISRESIAVAESSLNDEGKLVEESFNIAIPDNLNPGFYEIRVDISRLFRRIFLFEVTE